MDGYKTIITTPEFHFDDGWTGTFEISEESRKGLDELMKEHDAEAERFFDIFEHDVLCCMTDECRYCHLQGMPNCIKTLQDNFKRMVDNQKRMMIAFNKQRQDGLK